MNLLQTTIPPQAPDFFVLISSLQKDLKINYGVDLNVRDAKINQKLFAIENDIFLISLFAKELYKHNDELFLLKNSIGFQAIHWFIETAAIYSAEKIFNIIELIIRSKLCKGPVGVMHFVQFATLLSSLDKKEGCILLQLMHDLKNSQQDMLFATIFTTMIKIPVFSNALIVKIDNAFDTFRTKKGAIALLDCRKQQLLRCLIEQQAFTPLFLNLLKASQTLLKGYKNNPFKREKEKYIDETLRDLGTMLIQFSDDSSVRQYILEYSAEPHWVIAVQQGIEQLTVLADPREKILFFTGMLRIVHCLQQTNNLSLLAFDQHENSMRTILRPTKRYILETKLRMIKILQHYDLLSVEYFTRLFHIFNQYFEKNINALFVLLNFCDSWIRKANLNCVVTSRMFLDALVELNLSLAYAVNSPLKHGIEIAEHLLKGQWTTTWKYLSLPEKEPSVPKMSHF